MNQDLDHRAAADGSSPNGHPGTEHMKDHPFAGLFPLLSQAELNDLASDIETNGLRDPVMLHRGMILDGRNRYRACLLKSLPLRYEIYSGTNDDALDYVISKNVHRRHLSASQRALAMASYEEYRHGGARRNLVFQDANLHLDGIDPAKHQPTRSELADRGQVSERLIASAAAVRDHGATELSDAVRDGEIAVSAAADIAERPVEEQRAILDALPRDENGKLTKDAKKALAPIIKEVRAEKQIEKKQRRNDLIRDLGDKQRALPDRKFGVILADPEWPFEVWSEETGQDRAAANHYPTSTIEVIKSRPVASIAADECVLGLWATVPKLPAALDVMREWGFTYVSQIVWVKDRIGTGYWFRNNHEILLIGKKGSPPKPADGTQWKSAIEAPLGAHSEKPDFQYEFFETFFPGLPAIEFNARRARSGWEAWGLEAPIAVDPLPSDPVIRALCEANRARKLYPAGHTFAMTNPVINGEMVTLGTCTCGETFSYPFGRHGAEMMDAAIEVHRQKFDHLPGKVDGRGQPVEEGQAA